MVGFSMGEADPKEDLARFLTGADMQRCVT